MPKVAFMIHDYVAPVLIKGEYKGDYKARDDGGLVSKFLDFMFQNKIYCDSLYGSSGGAGQFLGFFYKEHIPAIRKFLEENGGTEEDSASYRLC